jgi:hypothetical protein
MNAFLLPATARVLISLVCFLTSGCNAFSSILEKANSHHLSSYWLIASPGYFSGPTHFIRTIQFNRDYTTIEKDRSISDCEDESSESCPPDTKIDFLTANLIKPGELPDSLAELADQSNSETREILNLSLKETPCVPIIHVFLRTGILRM